MHEHYRNRILLFGEQPNEMQIDGFNLHLEVVEGIDVLLLGTPIVCVEPIIFGVGQPFLRHTKVVLVLRILIRLGSKLGQL